jgi:DNA-binding transcriptional MerR regulator
MRMQKKRFRIGELAKHLEVEKFVVRFWEKEFNLKPHRSEGKQRFYEEKDIERFKHIKSLLYEGGFTIAGAKKHLLSTKQKSPTLPSIEPSGAIIPSLPTCSSQWSKQLLELQEKLIQLKKLL